MKSRVSKLVSMLCVVSMLASALPVSVFAADAGAEHTHGAAAGSSTYEIIPDVKPTENVGTMGTATFNAAAFSASAPRIGTKTVATFADGVPGDTIFSITGSTSNNKGTATYNSTTYTNCLKMESGTNIAFSADVESDLIMVFASGEGGKKVKVDGKDCTTGSDGTCTVRVAAGNHTVTKNEVMNLFYIELVPSHNHNYVQDTSKTVLSTCTKKGSTTWNCNVPGCPKPVDVRELPLADHTPVNVAEKPATCVTDGTTAGTKCAACGVILSGCTPIKASGTHTYGPDNKCTGCGMVKHDEHKWDAGTVTKQPTCTEKGVKTFKCTVEKCEATWTEEVNAQGHDLEDHAAVEPICGKNGYAAYDTCKREGCTYTTKKVTPHTDANGDGTCDVCHEEISKALSGAGGWFETIYVETNQFDPRDVENVSWTGASNGELDQDGLDYLVRAGLDGGKTRIDIPGLKAGDYTLTVTAGGTNYTTTVTVMAYDRSGYAHWGYTKGVGAYRDDGVIKDGAIILYVNNENKDTVTVTSADGTTVTGIGHILNSVGMDVGGGVNSKGGIPNNNKGIIKKLADDGTPLVVRIIDNVKQPEGVTVFDSYDYGGTPGDNGGMVRMKSGKDITIEGIGPNASLDGWGIHFMAESSAPKYGKSFEVRNIAFRNVPEDCIGMEGVQEGDKLTASVERIWIHNCAFYVPQILNPAESDKAQGDGACDFKRGEFMTMSYCHFDGYHKTNLIGASDDNLSFNVTWHHNWWERCEARGPLARKANVHIYNCLYDGTTDYAQNTRADAYIFSEYNTFLAVKNPGRVDGGGIKSFKDNFVSCQWQKATKATVVDKKTDPVVVSGNLHKSFELHADESYIPDGNYQLDIISDDYIGKIKAYAGPMHADVVGPEDVPSTVVPVKKLPTTAVVLPYDQAMNKTYIASTGEQTHDNINFAVTATANDSISIGGGTSTGGDIAFKVDEPVDITITDGGDSYPVQLLSAGGEVLIEGSGTASNCRAGVYFIQSSGFNYESKNNKKAKLAHLTIKPTTATEPPHEHSFSGWVQTVAPTCTREGVEKATCSCGETKSRPVPMTKHDFTTGVCPVCGALAEVLAPVDPNAPTVEVESVTIQGEDTITLKQGDTQELTAVIAPGNATKKTVKWTSDDETIATVTNRGVVAGKGHGTTTITANASGKTDTITVKVVGVSTDEYSFNAKTEGPATLSTSDKDAAPAGKYGTNGFFTASGSNTWRAVSFNSGDKSTSGMMLGSKESGSMSFTVASPATVRELRLSVSSTGGSNYSAVALKDSSGNYVFSTAGKKINVVSGTGATPVTYTDLPAGTYTIVSPKDVLPSDVDENKTSFGSDGKDNPNTRGVSLRSINLVTVETVSGDYVDVTGVTLDKTSVALEVNQSVTLNATVSPSNASNKAVTWNTSDPSVATATAGLVVARGAGTATITARAGGKSASCTVTVTAQQGGEVKVTKITVNGPNSVAVGDEIFFTATVEPADATNSSVTWSVNDTTVALISSSVGRLTGVGDGRVIVTATAKDGSGVKGTKVVEVGTGEKPEELNKQPLEDAIASAEKVIAAVLESADGTDVPASKRWVKPSVMTAAKKAVDAAKKTLDAADEQSEVVAAMTALSTAMDAFRKEIKPGTKTEGGTSTTTTATLDCKEVETLSDKDPLTSADVKAKGSCFDVTGTVTKRQSTGTTVARGFEIAKSGTGAIIITVPEGGTANISAVLSGSDSVDDKTGKPKTVTVKLLNGTTEVDYEGTKYDVLPKADTEVKWNNLPAGTYSMQATTKEGDVATVLTVRSITVDTTTTSGGDDTPTVDTSDLDAAIEEAKKTAEAVQVSSDGLDVEAPKKWVTQSVMLDFERAISDAEFAALLAASDADVTKAIDDLAAATKKFTEACTVGLKPTDKPVDPDKPDNPGGNGGGGGGGGGSTTSKTDKITDTFATISGAVKDGVAVAELTDSQAKTLTNNAVKNNSSDIIVTVKASDEADAARLNVSANALKNMADRTDAALNVQTDLGDVRLSAAAVADLGGNSGKNISVILSKTDSGVKVTVAAGNQILNKVDRGVTAIVDANGSGSVAVLMQDGKETILKKSYVEAGMLHANLPGSGEIVLKDNSKTFRDVENNWAKSAIDFATSRELFNGVNELDFAPNQAMTRSMLVTVLYRLEGTKSNAVNKFADIPAESWYTEAVAWANAEGIVSGKSATHFGPNDDITREQLATILYRYATKLCGMSEVSEDSKALEKFSDKTVVSGFAEDGMAWAVEQGIISGRGDGTLAPGGFASRAEVATMLMRFVKAII